MAINLLSVPASERLELFRELANGFRDHAALSSTAESRSVHLKIAGFWDDLAADLQHDPACEVSDQFRKRSGG
jgi:hypothetical protein